jgi:PhzF family phenazine biosynthesis protein
MDISRIAAFSLGDVGGNPAGVALCHTLPPPEEMQRVAAEIGFSETAFAAPRAGGWRVRYFAPEAEIPFCGHATIALGAALALRHGDGSFALDIVAGEIRVEAFRNRALIGAALHSPPAASRQAPAPLLDSAMRLFSLAPEDLDPRIPPALANAGAEHLVLALASRARLAAMAYDLAAGKALMRAAGLVTITSYICRHARSVFTPATPLLGRTSSEDPATGAPPPRRSPAISRELGWPHGGAEIESYSRGRGNMGVPCRLVATPMAHRAAVCGRQRTARLIVKLACDLRKRRQLPGCSNTREMRILFISRIWEWGADMIEYIPWHCMLCTALAAAVGSGSSRRGGRRTPRRRPRRRDRRHRQPQHGAKRSATSSALAKARSAGSSALREISVCRLRSAAVPPPEAEQAIASRMRRIAQAVGMQVGDASCTPTCWCRGDRRQQAFSEALGEARCHYFGGMSASEVGDC